METRTAYGDPIRRHATLRLTRRRDHVMRLGIGVACVSNTDVQSAPDLASLLHHPRRPVEIAQGKMSSHCHRSMAAMTTPSDGVGRNHHENTQPGDCRCQPDGHAVVRSGRSKANPHSRPRLQPNTRQRNQVSLTPILHHASRKLSPRTEARAIEATINTPRARRALICSACCRTTRPSRMPRR